MQPPCPRIPVDLKPDFAFVLGRHCDMADEARFLIERDGRPPMADLADNAASVALIEAAYAMSPIQAAYESDLREGGL